MVRGSNELGGRITVSGTIRTTEYSQHKAVIGSYRKRINVRALLATGRVGLEYLKVCLERGGEKKLILG